MLNALDSLHAIAQVLIGFRNPDDDLSLSVDRQDQRITGFLEAFEEFRTISLKALSDRMSLAMSSMASPTLHRI
jgi:hypothetical protein